MTEQKSYKELVRVVPIKNSKPNVNFEARLAPGSRVIISPVFEKGGAGKLKIDLSENELRELGEKLGMTLTGYLPPDLVNFSIALTIEGMELDLRMPMDRLRYAILRNHPDIATDKSKIKPNHRFYLVNEMEEMKKANKRAEIKDQCAALYRELTSAERREFCVVLGHGNNVQNWPDEEVNFQLRKMLEAEPEKFLKMFNDPNKDLRLMIQKAINMGILAKRAGEQIYYGDDLVAVGMDEVVKWFKDPRNGVVAEYVYKQTTGDSSPSPTNKKKTEK